MSEADSTARPRVTSAWFEELGEVETRFFVAIGRAVLSVAGLEKTLQLEVARVLTERWKAAGGERDDSVGTELARIEGLTAGQVLRELRALDLPPDLDQRIGDVIERRNRLVHGTIEDPELVRAIGTGELADATASIKQLSLDAASLAVELGTYAQRRLTATLGKSPQELLDAIRNVDPSTIEDARDRRQVEAIQALGEWPDLDTLNEPGTPNS